MRIIRVRHKDKTFYASLGDGVVISMGRDASPEPIPLQDVVLMPLLMPSKVIGVGYNFRERAEARGMEPPDRPVFFFRPPTSLHPNGRPLLLPPRTRSASAEAELAVVIGQVCYRVDPDNAARHIFGYTCANDVRIGDGAGDPFHVAGKSFNATCPIGPWLETQPPAMDEMPIRCLVNGAVVQEGMGSDMLFDPPTVISYLSHIMTLNPGDVIMLGAPAGTAELGPGDSVQVEIPGVGVLFNAVEGDEEPPVQ